MEQFMVVITSQGADYEETGRTIEEVQYFSSYNSEMALMMAKELWDDDIISMKLIRIAEEWSIDPGSDEHDSELSRLRKLVEKLRPQAGCVDEIMDAIFLHTGSDPRIIEPDTKPQSLRMGGSQGANLTDRAINILNEAFRQQKDK